MPLLPDKIEAFGFPISLVFDRSGKAYLSERISGILWKIEGDKFTAVRKFPILQALGHHEVGLLGITLDPDFDQNSYIYAYYTYGDTLENAANKVVRIKEGEEQEKIIIDNIPGGQIHNGGIIGFGPDKNLYICVGVDNAVMDKAQDIDYWGGKVLRVQPDGSIPKDNPYPNSPVFSFGHRNLFGIAFHPVTGLPFVSESGPEKDDEINIIRKGGNYGWPKVTGKVEQKAFIDPIITYTPTITPTQCCFVGNDLYFGSYNEGTVHKLVINIEFDRVSSDEIIYRGKPFGVIGVFVSPDGKMYVTTPNKVIKIS